MVSNYGCEEPEGSSESEKSPPAHPTSNGFWSTGLRCIQKLLLNWDLSDVVAQDPASADNTAGTQNTHTFVLFQNSQFVAEMQLSELMMLIRSPVESCQHQPDQSIAQFQTDTKATNYGYCFFQENDDLQFSNNQTTRLTLKSNSEHVRRLKYTSDSCIRSG